MKRGFAVVAACTVMACIAQVAYGGWSVEIVDDFGDVGLHTSLAFDPGGEPCISYHNETEGELWLSCRTGSGAWEHFLVDDPETPVGDYSSLAIGDDGSIHISYRRGVTVLSVLKYATTPDGINWFIETVDTHAQGVGHSTSLALDSSGLPHIAHRKRWGKQVVKYAQSLGSDWERSTVRNGSRSYYFGDTSITVDNQDRPLVAFLGSGDDAGLDLARKTGNKWKTSRIASFYAGDTVSMVLEESPGGTGTFHIVYSTGGYPDEHYEMNYVHCSKNTDGSPAEDCEFQTVDEWTGNDAGFDFASLAIDPSSGDLHLSYYDYRLGVLKYAKTQGGSWEPPEVVDSSGDVGLYSSIAIGVEGDPQIAYYDAANGDLRYAVFSDTCSEDADCEDQNDCTTDECPDGTCSNEPVADESPGCNLGTAVGMCCSGSCVVPVCFDDSDCWEFDADSCVDDGTCANTCVVECTPNDGYCPPGCSLPKDNDCPACDEYNDRKTCNADLRCRWSNQSKDCLPI